MSTEFYSYPLSNGSSVTWKVDGGNILEGSGSSIIKVKWDNTTIGTVTIIESNDNCSSQNVELKVNLRSENDSFTIIPRKSVARLWNEALLDAIRRDYARPTVHARNLFHTSVAMYDA
ncbi:hypothetical protein [Thalassobellus suaedae]|uniref:Uncharacterized protein n=1 Tax=Thalassobellus suaedae TaxID=3074124 RepID=A0ABY9XRS5_9FLAO|nr:hypothetical protein RHP51_14780 [Flavobacteriaceae bacterium HL-DH14]